MLDRFLQRKLLKDGFEAEGVITEKKVEAAKGQLGVMGFFVAVEGHVKFDDGTEGNFSSKGVDTSKVGDLDVGTIVPVRFDADRKHVVLDIPKLEADRQAKKDAAAAFLERRKAEEIAAADDRLAQRNRDGRHDRDAGSK